MAKANERRFEQYLPKTCSAQILSYDNKLNKYEFHILEILTSEQMFFVILFINWTITLVQSKMIQNYYNFSWNIFVSDFKIVIAVFAKIY